ncbi:Uncharacterized mitochondrial protein AtMg00310 [Linum perenne]
MTLLKTAIQAIPTYIMSLFLLPKKMVNRMNSLLRRFFWSGSMKKKSIHWCKGSKLCDSRSIGGLGFREFGSFNKALLARQGWRLINQTTACWASLLKNLYFPSGNFLSASKGRRPSWIWASLVDGISTLKLGCLRVIGNGSESTLTEDPWIPDLPSVRLNPQSDSSKDRSLTLSMTTALGILTLLTLFARVRRPMLLLESRLG